MKTKKVSFYKARSLCINGEISVFEAEIRGVLEAVKWVAELGVLNVVIECDSMLTVHALRNDTPNYLEVGNFLQECRSLLQSRPDVSVSFVKKQANKVAHLLARVPCEANCFIDFLSPPHSVLESIMYDVSSI